MFEVFTRSDRLFWPRVAPIALHSLPILAGIACFITLAGVTHGFPGVASGGLLFFWGASWYVALVVLWAVHEQESRDYEQWAFLAGRDATLPPPPYPPGGALVRLTLRVSALWAAVIPASALLSVLVGRNAVFAFAFAAAVIGLVSYALPRSIGSSRERFESALGPQYIQGRAAYLEYLETMNSRRHDRIVIERLLREVASESYHDEGEEWKRGG